MTRKTRTSAPEQTPAVQPVQVRREPSIAGRQRAARRTEVPVHLPELPPRSEWPARLRECSEPSVRIAPAIADRRWERLHAAGRNVTVD